MKRITQCLNPILANICQRAMQLESLNSIIQRYLPASFHGHYQVGSFNKGCLILVTSDAIWASQLRYHLPELRDQLRREANIYQLASIKINVNIGDLGIIKKNSSSQPALSEAARSELLASSEQCLYPPLSQALQHLARKTKRKIPD